MPHPVRRAAMALLALFATVPVLAQETAAPTDWETFVPPLDGSFQTWSDDPPDLGLVKRLFTLAYPEACGWALGTGATPDPQVFEFTYKDKYDEPESPERPFQLYQLFCSAGAYNEQVVFMAWDSVRGIRTIYFARPELDIAYADEGETVLEKMSVVGFAADYSLTNPVYEPETRTISFASYWRGLGDASSTGIYEFDNGNFVLKVYEVDPTYNGESDPIRVIDYSEPHAIAVD